jgi:hypothetical protein
MQRKVCSTPGKAAFRSQGRALAAVQRIRRDNAQAVAPLAEIPEGVYRCACGAWHLTRQSASGAERRTGQGGTV